MDNKANKKKESKQNKLQKQPSQEPAEQIDVPKNQLGPCAGLECSASTSSGKSRRMNTSSKVVEPNPVAASTATKLKMQNELQNIQSGPIKAAVPAKSKVPKHISKPFAGFDFTASTCAGIPLLMNTSNKVHELPMPVAASAATCSSATETTTAPAATVPMSACSSSNVFSVTSLYVVPSSSTHGIKIKIKCGTQTKLEEPMIVEAAMPAFKYDGSSSLKTNNTPNGTPRKISKRKMPNKTRSSTKKPKKALRNLRALYTALTEPATSVNVPKSIAKVSKMPVAASTASCFSTTAIASTPVLAASTSAGTSRSMNTSSIVVVVPKPSSTTTPVVSSSLKTTKIPNSDGTPIKTSRTISKRKEQNKTQSRTKKPKKEEPASVIVPKNIGKVAKMSATPRKIVVAPMPVTASDTLCFSIKEPTTPAAISRSVAPNGFPAPATTAVMVPLNATSSFFTVPNTATPAKVSNGATMVNHIPYGIGNAQQQSGTSATTPTGGPVANWCCSACVHMNDAVQNICVLCLRNRPVRDTNADQNSLLLLAALPLNATGPAVTVTNTATTSAKVSNAPSSSATPANQSPHGIRNAQPTGITVPGLLATTLAGGQTMTPNFNWYCSACTFENYGLRQICKLCYTKRPMVDTNAGQSYWSCPACTLHNDALRKVCECCETERPAGTDNKSEDVKVKPTATEPIQCGQCIVCLCADSEFVFINCGHLCVCNVCVKMFSPMPTDPDSSKSVENWRHKCPKCRGTIHVAPILVFQEKP